MPIRTDTAPSRPTPFVTQLRDAQHAFDAGRRATVAAMSCVQRLDRCESPASYDAARRTDFNGVAARFHDCIAEYVSCLRAIGFGIDRTLIGVARILADAECAGHEALSHAAFAWAREAFREGETHDPLDSQRVVGRPRAD